MGSGSDEACGVADEGEEAASAGEEASGGDRSAAAASGDDDEEEDMVERPAEKGRMLREQVKKRKMVRHVKPRARGDDPTTGLSDVGDKSTAGAMNLRPGRLGLNGWERNPVRRLRGHVAGCLSCRP
jgi:hypothetical protein